MKIFSKDLKKLFACYLRPTIDCKRSLKGKHGDIIV